MGQDMTMRCRDAEDVAIIRDAATDILKTYKPGLFSCDRDGLRHLQNAEWLPKGVAHFGTPWESNTVFFDCFPRELPRNIRHDRDLRETEIDLLDYDSWDLPLPENFLDGSLNEFNEVAIKMLLLLKDGKPRSRLDILPYPKSDNPFFGKETKLSSTVDYYLYKVGAIKIVSGKKAMKYFVITKKGQEILNSSEQVALIALQDDWRKGFDRDGFF